MADVGGFDPNFSTLVSVLRQPTASPDGEWELLDRVDNMDEASDGEEMVSVVVTHFSNLIPAVEKRSAVENSRGYIIKPIRHKFLRLVRPVGNAGWAKRGHRIGCCTW